MSNDDWIQTSWPQDRMWTLSDDRFSVRLQLPPLPVEGVEKPLEVFIDFDAGTIDEMIERLIEVRARMLPPPRVSSD